MKTRLNLVAVTLAAACSAALAGTEYGTVISAKAVTAPATVQQQQCTEQQAAVQPPSSGAGALLGAIVGGVIGHNMGEGFGRAAATGLGAVAGTVIGDRTEAANTPAVTTPVRNCQLVSSVENRVVGYDVTYEYNGQRYTTRMAQDPGDRIALNVSVAPQQGTATPVATAVQPTVAASAPPVVVAPAVVPYATYSPYYAPYYAPYRAYYGPVVPQVGVVIGGGHWHHWR